jgi:hypothetical protein
MTDDIRTLKQHTTKGGAVTFEAAEFPTMKEAIAFAETADLEAIHLDGRYFVLDPLEADRLDEAGVTFAFVYEIHGKIVTIPVN